MKTDRTKRGVNETEDDGRKSSDMMPRGGDQARDRDGKRKEGEGGREGFGMNINSDGVKKPLTNSLCPLGECRQHACSPRADKTLIRTT